MSVSLQEQGPQAQEASEEAKKAPPPKTQEKLKKTRKAPDNYQGLPAPEHLKNPWSSTFLLAWIPTRNPEDAMKKIGTLMNKPIASISLNWDTNRMCWRANLRSKWRDRFKNTSLSEGIHLSDTCIIPESKNYPLFNSSYALRIMILGVNKETFEIIHNRVNFNIPHKQTAGLFIGGKSIDEPNGFGI